MIEALGCMTNAMLVDYLTTNMCTWKSDYEISNYVVANFDFSIIENYWIFYDYQISEFEWTLLFHTVIMLQLLFITNDYTHDSLGRCFPIYKHLWILHTN